MLKINRITELYRIFRRVQETIAIGSFNDSNLSRSFCDM